jgi:hypothetical protein
MPKCKEHNEEKRLIGCDRGRLVYRCESCFERSMKGLNRDFENAEAEARLQKVKVKATARKKFQNALIMVTEK